MSDWHKGALALCVAPNGRWVAPGEAFNSRYFRKISDHAPDAEDAETIRLLNGKPAREMA